MSNRKQYLYHVTNPENVPSILRDGLKKKNGFAVYMSENPYSWWRPGLAILRVRITGLKDLKTFLPELDEVLSFDDISPLRISRWHIQKSAYKKYQMLNEKGEKMPRFDRDVEKFKIKTLEWLDAKKDMFETSNFENPSKESIDNMIAKYERYKELGEELQKLGDKINMYPKEESREDDEH